MDLQYSVALCNTPRKNIETTYILIPRRNFRSTNYSAAANHVQSRNIAPPDAAAKAPATASVPHAATTSQSARQWIPNSYPVSADQ